MFSENAPNRIPTAFRTAPAAQAFGSTPPAAWSRTRGHLPRRNFVSHWTKASISLIGRGEETVLLDANISKWVFEPMDSLGIWTRSPYPLGERHTISPKPFKYDWRWYTEVVSIGVADVQVIQQIGGFLLVGRSSLRARHLYDSARNCRSGRERGHRPRRICGVTPSWV
jgi:hypothetical protein